MTKALQLGDVYRLRDSSQLVRVIAFDDEVVMYDVWWPDVDAWSLHKSKRSGSYFRTTIDVFLMEWEFLRAGPYTAVEASLHRPDLPFSVANYETPTWYAGLSTLLTGVAAVLANVSPSESRAEVLSARAIFIEPFGPKGGVVGSSLVEAANGQAFTALELLTAAWLLQEPHLRQKQLTTGIGLHRAGLKRQLPSYYVWGAKSRLEAPVQGPEYYPSPAPSAGRMLH